MQTLRRRIMVSFAAFALAVAAVFGFAAAVLLYGTEDEFFDVLLREEATTLEAARRASGAWPTPHYTWMSLHDGPASLPDDLRAALLAEPRRREFRGTEGRHYHVRPLQAMPLPAGSAARATPDAWLVAEVERQLVLRPNRDEMLRLWATVGLGIFALALLLAAWLARRIARPLSQFAHSLRAADPAHATAALAVDARDAEIATVVAAFDDLQRRVAGFVARERAFTRDVSHELRNPLSVVRSTAARLAADTALPDEARRGLQRICGACDRLEWTMRSLLELARERRTGGPREERPAPILVRPVLEEAIVELEEPLRERALVPTLELAADFTLPIDRPALFIVLGNLLGNACHYAAPGALRVWSEGRVLWVANPTDPDEAVASPTAAAELASARASVRRADRPGHGLGLSISARLCERSALTLTWEKQATAFVVRLAPAEAGT